MDQKEQEIHQQYQQLVKNRSPKPKVAQDLWRAFLVGGLFGLLGQAFFDLFSKLEPSQSEASGNTLFAMILVGAILTAFGVYDKIAEWGGAGAAVPITGFANTIVAAAMDFRREGFVLGLGSKMFSVAGPILVYGALSGFVAGLLKYLILGHVAAGG